MKMTPEAWELAAGGSPLKTSDQRPVKFKYQYGNGNYSVALEGVELFVTPSGMVPGHDFFIEPDHSDPVDA